MAVTNIPVTGGGGGASAVSELTDVNLTSPANGDFLKFNGTEFINDSTVSIKGIDLTPSYNANAVQTTDIAIGSNTSAAGGNSIAIGNETATSSLSIYGVSLGYNVTNHSTNGVAIGRNATTASSQNDAVAIGYGAQAIKRYSVAIGRYAQATGSDSIQVGGNAVNTSGTKSVGLIGRCTANNSVAIGDAIVTKDEGIAIGFQSINMMGESSVVLGNQITSDSAGTLSFGAGRFRYGGDAAYHVTVLRYRTTAATTVELATGGGGMTATPTNYFTTSDGSLYDVQATVVARENLDGTGEKACYRFDFVCERNVGVSTLALVTADVGKTVVYESDVGLDANITMDTTSGRIKVEATGLAGKNISWVATLRYTRIKATSVL